MVTWILMFFSCLLVPGVLMSFGSALRKNAPGQINALFGYRTALSMKNRDTWEFANTYWGKLAWKWGLWMLIGTTAALLAVFFASEDVVYIVSTIVCCVQVVLILATIPIVERKLKQEFDENGNRRN